MLEPFKDAEGVLRKSSERPLTFNGEMLNVVPLEPRGPHNNAIVSQAVVVTKIAPETSEDLLYLFFENMKRSGGGSIEELVMKEGGTKAVITFFEAHGQSADCMYFDGSPHTGKY